MCGIIGYVGERACEQLLLQGLRRLEYRGYDSAGVAMRGPDGLERTRSVGPLAALESVMPVPSSGATHGIGHTRWATHGGVSEQNAHPFLSSDGSVAIVLNGIVENYRELRAELTADGCRFTSETDAESVAHLIERQYAGDLAAAVRATAERLEGHFAFVAIHRDCADLIVATRRQCPLVVGLGDGETFIASNAAAFIGETRSVQFPADGDIVELTPDGVVFHDVLGDVVVHDEVQLDMDDCDVEKAGFESFMLKEISEQPHAVAATIDANLTLDGIGLSRKALGRLERVVILAAGSSYHAGVVARYAIEGWARVPVECDISSEWLYRDPVVGPNTLVIGVSQSGETRDTISALRLAREQGAHTLAITNMAGSQIVREVDSVLYTHAGVEMSVAASKTFTAQVALFHLIALELAGARKALPTAELWRLLAEVQTLPCKMARFLDGAHPIHEIAQRHAHKPFFLFLGRHAGLPVALEGALKLKEISYIPTEAYAAGELKHGPIALLDDQTPVVVVATDSHVYEKVMSNVEETRARGAQVIAIATDGNEEIQHQADDVVYVPRTHPLLQAVLAVLPLQLLAYSIAELRGLNVDRPRNLAKTVTVE